MYQHTKLATERDNIESALMASRLILLLQLIISVHLASADLPAIFIFGDSTVDVGTNNHLKGCLATANNPYYGIDYAHSKPTGRFSNGCNTADAVVRLLRGDFEESPPPFLSLVEHMSSFKSKILRGVNFASGGSGIFLETGNKTYKNVTYLGKQIQQFATVREIITEVLGPAKAECHLANSLYMISVGSNDFFDYIQYGSNLSASLLLDSLHKCYANHLKNLYNLGARKFGIVSVAPIGCVPAIRSFTGGSCLPQLNELAQAFYTSVQTLLENFSSSYNGVHYSLGNAYRMTKNIIDNPGAKGFVNVTYACCGTGPFNGGEKCTPKSDLCLNRTSFLFWDWFHPTQQASRLAAETLVFGERPEYVTPMNFSRLAAIVVT